MDIATSAAVIVGLRTIGKPAGELVKDFVGRIFAPVGDALGQAMAHPIVEWNKRRAATAEQLLSASAQILEDAGCEPQPVPPYILLPLLEKGSLVEDSDLQAIWSQLLASAASAVPGLAVWPSFPQILSELSPQEAKLLSWIYSGIQSRQDQGEFGGTAYLWLYYEQNKIERTPAWAVMEDNIIRLQLLRRTHPVLTGGDLKDALARIKRPTSHFDDIPLKDARMAGEIVTALGAAFMKACAGPNRARHVNAASSQ